MEETEESPSVNENNADWILDSLVAYLRGPIWIMPILNFIEQKSVGMANEVVTIPNNRN